MNKYKIDVTRYIESERSTPESKDLFRSNFESERSLSDSEDLLRRYLESKRSVPESTNLFQIFFQTLKIANNNQKIAGEKYHCTPLFDGERADITSQVCTCGT